MATVKLYTRDGTAIDVPIEEAQKLLASGEYGVPAQERFNVADPSGKLISLAGSELVQASRHGYSLATPQQLAEHRYGQQDVRSFLEGAARGLTFGLSDAAMVAMGADKKDLAGRMKANPGAALAGEITGGVGGLFLPGGALVKGVAGLGARTARSGQGALLRVISKEGMKPSTLRQIAAATGGMAAGGAVEGAIYGLGQGVTEAALGEPKTVGQTLVGFGGQALRGAGFGAAGGAILGGAAESFIAATRKTAGVVGKNLVGWGAEKAEKHGAERLWTDLGISKKARRDMTRKGGREAQWIDDVQETLRREGLHPDGKPLYVPGAKPEQMIERIEDVLHDAGDTLGNLRAKAEGLRVEAARSATGTTPGITPGPRRLTDGKPITPIEFDQERFARELEEKVFQHLKKESGVALPPAYRRELHDVLEYAREIFTKAHRQGGWSLKDGWDTLFTLGKTKMTEAMRMREGPWNRLEGILREELHRTTKALLNPVDRKAYEQARRVYRDLADIADKTVAREGLSQARSWSARALDYGVRSALYGMTFGSGVGGAMGAAQRTGVFAAGAFGVDWAVRKAIRPESISNMRWIQTRLEDAAAQTDKAIQSFLSTKKRAAITPLAVNILQDQYPGKTRAQAVKAHVAELDALVADPERLAEVVASPLQEVEASMPQVAEEVAATQARLYNHLVEKAPRPPRMDIQPDLDTWEPSPQQTRHHENRLAAGQAPVDVLIRMAQGIPPLPEEMEVLQVAYPELLHAFRVQMAEEVTLHSERLTYQQRQLLARFMQHPVDGTFEPEFIAHSQQNYQEKPQKSAAPSPGQDAAKSDITQSSLATGTQRIQSSLAKS